MDHAQVSSQTTETRLSGADDSLAAGYMQQLQGCIQTIRQAEGQEEATEQYHQLRDRLVAEYPDLVALLDTMWEALLYSQRSATFWERLCDTEKQLTDRMAASHVQLHQNYLRLVQEQ